MSKLNKLLALIFLLLAGYVWFYVVQHKKMEKEGSAVFKSSLESVHSIHIAVTGNPKISLLKRNGRWQMIAPLEDVADKSKIEKLLTYAQKIEKERIVALNTLNLSSFGLSPPKAILTLETHAGLKELYFGHKTIDEKKIFACLGGSKEIFLLMNEVEEQLLLQPFQLREKRLLLLNRNGIETLTVSFKGVEIYLQKEESGWRQKGGPPLQDFDKLGDVILQDLGRIGIFDCVKGTVADHGLDQPRVWVKVSGPHGFQKFLFGNEGSQGFVYAKDTERPGLFLVDKPRIWNLLQR